MQEVKGISIDGCEDCIFEDNKIINAKIGIKVIDSKESKFTENKIINKWLTNPIVDRKEEKRLEQQKNSSPLLFLSTQFFQTKRKENNFTIHDYWRDQTKDGL